MFGKQILVCALLLAVGLSLTITSRYHVEHLGTITVNQLRQAELDRHNELRAQHGCPPLVLDNSLNNAAQAYAKRLYSTTSF